jgi:UDP-N-acetylglucosamine 1-carboxyvinyltransferase
MYRSIQITGGNPLHGSVAIAGSSNQVSKAILASLLTTDPVTIKNCPCVNERWVTEQLVSYLGAHITNIPNTNNQDISIDPSNLQNLVLTKEWSQKNRISILALPSLLHKYKKASIYGSLGGDQIGKRPVDFHFSALEQMGCHMEYDQTLELMHITCPKGLQGAHIVLPFPSVMTTENILLAAVLASGRTIIENAAVEPEVLELTKMLQKMGADISISANRTFSIRGIKKLRGCAIRIMPDRNQAVSFACAALATKGSVLLEKFPHDPLFSFLNYVQRMGGNIHIDSKGVFVEYTPNMQGILLEVEVHPGFMTDWQQPFMVLCTQVQNHSVFHETIFENRLSYTKILNSMGANIELSTSCLGEAPCRFKLKNHIHSAIVQGNTPLHSIETHIPQDIRAGMALVIAGLVATGTTTLHNFEELERKYDSLVTKLNGLGAQITGIV